MTKLCQSGIWPILYQLIAILAKLLDMDFKFVYINFDIQTRLILDFGLKNFLEALIKNQPRLVRPI